MTVPHELSHQQRQEQSYPQRHDWTLDEINALFALPFNDLLFQAQQVHRAHFDANAVQVSTLLSIKTGACPEDCKYCPQSGHYNTQLEKEKLLEIEKSSNKPRQRKKPVPAVFVWAQRGAAPGIKTCCWWKRWFVR
ncbi:hypothetical protein HORIV_09070 [Vreelandella olivaria]|uniref:Biotin synthase n=1 Tax=Vreelandella olivaria TaxID=390919 RepID=A0ABM8HK45_9GAMM|nr:hypothetical protein HORIV_09070 [Halomonas olivaria]